MAKIETKDATTAVAEESGQRCKVCNAVVEYPNFQCSKQPGRHVVESKTYYHAGSATIQSIRDRRKFSPTIILKHEKQRMDENNLIVTEPGIDVQFFDAQYTTADPEEQYYLERLGAKNEIFWGDEGLQMWRRNQLTDAQQVEIQKAELADLTEKVRKVKESQDLLAQVKARTGA